MKKLSIFIKVVTKTNPPPPQKRAKKSYLENGNPIYQYKNEKANKSKCIMTKYNRCS